ncbi:uncharacterized protein LOC124135888 [Haliotis rufescens]|uniref:uncharacterized protein LOC124135888 n=1 Tax=Haliotis rufescens TaxID=6454 RepID=UPI00201F590F|nr:uncharacterized protein LOC124135888 [Haliotis rufescens]
MSNLIDKTRIVEAKLLPPEYAIWVPCVEQLVANKEKIVGNRKRKKTEPSTTAADRKTEVTENPEKKPAKRRQRKLSHQEQLQLPGGYAIFLMTLKKGHPSFLPPMSGQHSQWWKPTYSPNPPVIMISDNDDEARKLAALPPMEVDAPTLLDVVPPPSPIDTFHGGYLHYQWSCDVPCLFQGFEWIYMAINMVRTVWN